MCVMERKTYWTSCSPSLPWVNPQEKSNSKLSFCPFVVSKPIHGTINGRSLLALFVPYKMIGILTSFIYSSMTRTTISWVGTNDKIDSKDGGMGI